jgi:hypothetical protein
MGFIYNQIEHLRNLATDKELSMYDTKYLSETFSQAANTIEILSSKLKVAENKETKDISYRSAEWQSPKKHPKNYESVLIYYERTGILNGLENGCTIGYVANGKWCSRFDEFRVIAWMYLPEVPKERG